MILFFPIAGSDLVQSRVSPEEFYLKKISNLNEGMNFEEEELIRCRKQLSFFIKNRKYTIQKHLIDGLSSTQAVDLWKEEVDITQRFCEMYEKSIEDAKNELMSYTKKLNSLP